MPKTSNTQPKKIIDVNGKETTVHAKVDIAPSASNKKVAAVSSPPAPAADNGATFETNDDIFGEVTINKKADGSFVASASMFVSAAGLEAISEDGHDLSTYLRTNSDEIRKFLMAEYGATVVTVYPQTSEIEMRFEAEIDSAKPDQFDAIEALYSKTRATSADEHAYGSDKLAWGIQSHIDSGGSDVETFARRGMVYELDD